MEVGRLFARAEAAKTSGGRDFLFCIVGAFNT